MLTFDAVWERVQAFVVPSRFVDYRLPDQKIRENISRCLSGDLLFGINNDDSDCKLLFLDPSVLPHFVFSWLCDQKEYDAELMQQRFWVALSIPGIWQVIKNDRQLSIYLSVVFEIDSDDSAGYFFKRLSFILESRDAIFLLKYRDDFKALAGLKIQAESLVPPILRSRQCLALAAKLGITLEGILDCLYPTSEGVQFFERRIAQNLILSKKDFYATLQFTRSSEAEKSFPILIQSVRSPSGEVRWACPKPELVFGLPEWVFSRIAEAMRAYALKELAKRQRRERETRFREKPPEAFSFSYFLYELTPIGAVLLQHPDIYAWIESPEDLYAIAGVQNERFQRLFSCPEFTAAVQRVKVHPSILLGVLNFSPTDSGLVALMDARILRLIQNQFDFRIFSFLDPEGLTLLQNSEVFDFLCKIILEFKLISLGRIKFSSQKVRAFLSEPWRRALIVSKEDAGCLDLPESRKLKPALTWLTPARAERFQALGLTLSFCISLTDDSHTLLDDEALYHYLLSQKAMVSKVFFCSPGLLPLRELKNPWLCQFLVKHQIDLGKIACHQYGGNFTAFWYPLIQRYVQTAEDFYLLTRLGAKGIASLLLMIRAAEAKKEKVSLEKFAKTIIREGGEIRQEAYRDRGSLELLRFMNEREALVLIGQLQILKCELDRPDFKQDPEANGRMRNYESLFFSHNPGAGFPEMPLRLEAFDEKFFGLPWEATPGSFHERGPFISIGRARELFQAYIEARHACEESLKIYECVKPYCTFVEELFQRNELLYSCKEIAQKIFEAKRDHQDVREALKIYARELRSTRAFFFRALSFEEHRQRLQPAVSNQASVSERPRGFRPSV